MIQHLKINYNKKLLLKESEQITYKPFESGHKSGSWFDHQPDWMYGKIKNKDLINLEETNRILSYIIEKTKATDVRPRIYKQAPNVEVPMHTDQSTKSAINIVLNDEYSPITFEEIGDVLYECALFDTTKRHGVKPHREERVILKYSIFDKSFEELKDRIW